MKLSVLLSLAFATAAVRAAVPVGKVINIRDFKRNVLDLAFGSGSELSPIQTLNHKTHTLPQGWIIQAGANGLFTIKNIMSGTFVSFTGAVTGVNPTTAQLQPHVIEPNTGEAVTSWPFQSSTIIGLSTPVTIQSYDPAASQQIFKFPTFS
ncbi:COesterase domain-containing protein [Mycena venus]|uniref:COesterase domain-containing protein n=1 Tax=Mycena venus TaxID=2733690 RepID=A0A8H6XET1_9AGAR|nr:COesterase domain-containing protein [Mycena venus]